MASILHLRRVRMSAPISAGLLKVVWDWSGIYVCKQVVPMVVKVRQKEGGMAGLLQPTANLNSLIKKRPCQNESLAHQKPVIRAHSLRVKLSVLMLPEEFHPTKDHFNYSTHYALTRIGSMRTLYGDSGEMGSSTVWFGLLADLHLCVLFF